MIFSSKNKKYFQNAKRFTPGGVHSPVRSFKGLSTTPKFIKKGKGAYIFDEEGKKYIDFCQSFGPLILGHQNPKVKKEMKKALSRGWSYGACERYSLELAEYIVQHIPFIDQIRFVNSGTEAVMTALRLARGVTRKNKIIKFNGCYHGHVDSMLIKAGSGLAGTAEASSLGITPNCAQDTLIVDLADREAVERCFSEYDDIAGIIIEPLPANNGLLSQDVNFLKFLREITKKNKALLIFDEVISGFRCSFQGMAGKTKVTPDILTYGKIIGGGMPVGAIAAKKEIMENLAPVGGVYQAGTLSGNPLAMSAGLSTLKIINDSKFYLQLEQKTQMIANALEKWLNENHEKIGSEYKVISSDSLFWPIPLKPEERNPQTIDELPKELMKPFDIFYTALLKKGIYLSPNPYEVGFVSLAHTEKVIKDLEKRL